MNDTSPIKGQERAPIKFLVVAIDREEARHAAFFAGRRARNSGADVVLLHVMPPPEFGHWASVAETMRAEAIEQAEALLREFAAEVKAQAGDDPEQVIREGDLVKEIRQLIDEDSDIAFVFLGAAAGPGGPGPLVSAAAKNPQYLSARPIVNVIVPGEASREELRRLAG